MLKFKSPEKLLKFWNENKKYYTISSAKNGFRLKDRKTGKEVAFVEDRQ